MSSIAFAAVQTAPWRRIATAAALARAGIERWLAAESERLVLWIPVAIGMGVAAWFALPGPASWIGCAAVGSGLAMAGLALGGRAGRCLLVFGLLVALGLAHIWWRAERVATPRLERPVITVVEGTVERIDRLPQRGQTRLWVRDAGVGLPPLVRFNIAGEADPAIRPGARISVRARLMPPPPPLAPGGYDFPRIAWFQGLGATGRALGLVDVMAAAPARGWKAGLDDIRARLTAHVQSRLPATQSGIAAALVTGDQGGIPAPVVQDMRDSGLAHLLSISGLHVSAVVGFMMIAMRRLLALSPWLALRMPITLLAAIAAAVAGILYTLIAGAEVPTVRSCLAALIVLAGIAVGREAISLRTVAAGATFILLLWPEAIVGPSFQLSFGAVTAIIALYESPLMQRRFGRRPENAGWRLARAGGALLLTGVAVELALSPIALFHFNRTGLYGALANIIAIPFTTFVIMPLEALALCADMAGLGAPLWWLTGLSLQFLVGLAAMVAAAPGATALLPTMPNAAFAAMIAGGVWLCLWRTPVRWLGCLPALVGAAVALTHQPPDLLVTGDGRHLAWRAPDGALMMLRDRAGEFTRDMLGDAAATRQSLRFDTRRDARCSRDLCLFDIDKGGRRWRIAATRSSYFIDRDAFEPVCARSDIVVSDRNLPYWCRPSWLKLDRRHLERTGAIAIRFDPLAIDSVAARAGRHPWWQQQIAPNSRGARSGRSVTP